LVSGDGTEREGVYIQTGVSVGEEREVEENGGEEREGKETDGCPLTWSF
jgi:hypothetical protein